MTGLSGFSVSRCGRPGQHWRDHPVHARRSPERFHSILIKFWWAPKFTRRDKGWVLRMEKIELILREIVSCRKIEILRIVQIFSKDGRSLTSASGGVPIFRHLVRVLHLVAFSVAYRKQKGAHRGLGTHSCGTEEGEGQAGSSYRRAGGRGGAWAER